MKRLLILTTLAAAALTGLAILAGGAAAQSLGGRFVGAAELRPNPAGRCAADPGAISAPSFLLGDDLVFIDPDQRAWLAPRGACVGDASVPAPLAAALGGAWRGAQTRASVILAHVSLVRTEDWAAGLRAYHAALITDGVAAADANRLYYAARRHGPRWGDAARRRGPMERLYLDAVGSDSIAADSRLLQPDFDAMNVSDILADPWIAEADLDAIDRRADIERDPSSFRSDGFCADGLGGEVGPIETMLYDAICS